MQKVITITVFNTLEDKSDFFYAAKDYPELNSLLSEGYKVTQVTPIICECKLALLYSLTFVLDKK